MISIEIDNYTNNHPIMEWLLEDKNPEVKLRILKEYFNKKDDDKEVVDTKELLKSSKIYEDAMLKLNSEKVWPKYDAITSFAEWGLTRNDLDIDQNIITFIEDTKFKPMCGEALLLRNLVKLGYYKEDSVRNEIELALSKIKEDGGFGCFSKSKKINDPKVPHKSCTRITSNYLLLIAEMKRNNLPIPCEHELVQYFLKRNVIYRTDDMSTMVVQGIENTYYPPDAIMNGIQNIIYALCILNVGLDDSLYDSWQNLNMKKDGDGKYILGHSKTNPSFRVGAKNKPNKWITLYAIMSQKVALENK
jgi:hypothetical protein